MKLISISVRYGAGICAAVAALAGCGNGSSQSPFIPSSPVTNAALRESDTPARSGPELKAHSTGYVYVSNRTRQGSSELLVYPEGVQNPAPSLRITQNLADVGGIALDSNGNVYVANGGSGDVLEFAPGGADLVETYSLGLVHPIDVTVANGTLYVSDQGDAANGYSQQVVEYTIGNGTPLAAIGGPGYSLEMNEGVAVDPLPSTGNFFESASSLTAIPFGGGCTGSTDLVTENLFPTLWQVIQLSNNQQASGLAFAPDGTLYASDQCANDVAIYSRINYIWTYLGKVPGTFNAPLFLTINHHFLAIPSGASMLSGNPGSVTVIDLTKHAATANITKSLQYPIGAAASPGS